MARGRSLARATTPAQPRRRRVGWGPAAVTSSVGGGGASAATCRSAAEAGARRLPGSRRGRRWRGDARSRSGLARRRGRCRNAGRGRPALSLHRRCGGRGRAMAAGDRRDRWREPPKLASSTVRRSPARTWSTLAGRESRSGDGGGRDRRSARPATGGEVDGRTGDAAAEGRGHQDEVEDAERDDEAESLRGGHVGPGLLDRAGRARPAPAGRW